MSTLTKKQQEVYATIKQCYHKNGYTPTLDEIASEVGINTRSTIHKHVKALIEAGKLLSASGKRAYNILEEDMLNSPQLKLGLSLPLQGRIAAGKPIEAVPDQTEISPGEMFTGPNRYALEVRGDSMIDIGIMDGDYVVIQHQESARNGEIVVALVEREEATLKRIYNLQDGRVELRPENRNMDTMIYPASSVKVQGKMVGLFRNYS